MERQQKASSTPWVTLEAWFALCEDEKKTGRKDNFKRGVDALVNGGLVVEENKLYRVK